MFLPLVIIYTVTDGQSLKIKFNLIKRLVIKYYFWFELM